MDRPSPTPSFDESPSHDSAIGTPHKTGSSRVSSGTAPSAFSPLAAPPTPTNSDQSQAQQTQARSRPSPFDYATAARQHDLNARSRANSDTWPENQVPLPPSRPGSVPSVSADEHAPSEGYTTEPESPTSPSRQRVEEDNVGGEVVQRVLSLPRGRRTPSLRNAPDLRWDLSGQLPPRSSLDELGSVVSEDDVPVGRREIQRTRLSPVVEGPSPIGERPSPDEERPITPLLPPTPTRQPTVRDFARILEVTQHHDRINFSRPTPARYSRTPSPPRIRDAFSEHQPHRLSPLNESPDLRPQRYPGEYEGHPAYSPQPPYRATSSRATYSAEDEDPSLSTAQLLPVQRVTHEDVRRSEMTIVSRDRDGELEPLSSRERRSEAPEVEIRFIQELRDRAARHAAWGQRHPFRRKMRKMWDKVKGFFDF